MAIRSFRGKNPVIHSSVYVDSTALVVGEVSIDEDSSIWPMAVVRGDVHRIDIGARTNIQDGSVLHVSHDSEYHPGGSPLVIGNDVTVGHNVVLHACTVEDRCLVGIGAVVLDGAIIRESAMIGAGSLITPGQDIEGGFLWVGRPAKRVRELTEQELTYLGYSAGHYVRLKNQHAQE